MLIQAITNQSNYKIQFPRFTGSPRVATKPIQAAADSFVRSAEKPVFDTIRDIKNYLKINVDKIKDGEIFNTPLTKDGDSLLMAFLHIKPIEEEEEEYESLLYKMEKMPKINYDQKDSMDMTSLEWMMSAENFALLDLMKDKKLTQDPMTHTTYKHIKNPEFRKALVELEGRPFLKFVEHRQEWERETCFVYPGPIQYWGPSSVADRATRTLMLEQGKQ